MQCSVDTLYYAVFSGHPVPEVEKVVEAGKELPRNFSGWQKVFEKIKEVHAFLLKLTNI